MINLVNKKIGKLLVIKKSNQRGNRNQIKWECICDCGNRCCTTGESLKSGHTKSCGCLKKEFTPYNKLKNRSIAILNRQYYQIIKRHKKLGFDINEIINLKKYKELVINPCVYCGIKSSIRLFDRFGTKGQKSSNVSIAVNGIDRENNKQGYIASNCVTCCKHCNIAKNILNKKEYLNFIKRVYNYQKSI